MTGNVALLIRIGLRSLLATAWLLWLSSLAHGAATSEAVSQPTPLAPALDEVWTISSRQVGCGEDDCSRLSYWRFCHETHEWLPSSHEAFLASDDPLTPSCFFVHGNRVGHGEAFDIGWRAYQRLRAQAPPARRFRFVIWSWPSTRIQGQIKDVRTKARQSEAHAYYLAWLLDQIDPRTPVSLVGYSYGARLVAGSLHILGGGTSAGRTLATRVHPDRSPVRAVLLAGALDSNALLPRARNGLALTQVERMLVLTNPADEVLKYYRLLYGLGSKIQALGAAGAAGLSSLGTPGKVVHWNVSRLVGPDHDWTRYLYSPAIVSRMESFALYLE
jgi:hypothetical protein